MKTHYPESKCCLILFSFILLSSTAVFCQVKMKGDTAYLKQIVDNTTNQLNALNQALTNGLNKSQKKIDSLTRIISGSKTQQNDKIDALNSKFIELEKIQAIKDKNETDQNSKKFEAGKAAISSMKSGVKILNFTYKLLDLDQSIEKTTSIWADSTFRNLWNKIEDWGTIAGATVAVSGFATSNETSSQISGLTAGVGIVGLSKLLGTAFGINQKKFRSKMERIDLSIRAYDDLLMRNKQLKDFIESNKDFESRILAFEVEYTKAANKDLLLYISKLVDLLDEYKSVLKQIPTYLDGISSVGVSYINNKDKYKELPMKDIFDSILTKCKGLKEDYSNEVKPLIDISPEIKKLLFR